MHFGEHEWDRGRRRSRDRRRTPFESIIAGAAFVAVFGVLFVLRRGEWWWIFPMVFAGVLPILEGIRRIFSRKKEAAESTADKATDTEHRLLQAAHDGAGRLTAASAALSTGLPLKSTQEMLERLVKEGHAVMNVLDSGVIEFQFPEFLPPSQNAIDAELKRLKE